ncbi:glycoside hydrolase family 3 C-terminal domain-containing protein [Pseudoalteromonas sp. SR43-6]|uniref:glycoside hydrolase family 3 C-terminal domain-containing protein n=1 Tax=unclassified Pseudoalteromonas TaxID=194690 RepID=UPI0015FB2716|nr:MULTISPECIES: glycoside hydrolase family 3 C-terminal domain-containing protein [unclassified Pseudoalteromonas]MBB1287634.1 glycoside hydrolase family 3 C-terminal domain-containing protein [Pseudoalteromonas sp. SR41-5]MBB1373236.1 glycoside hydrolase family 3 C-terminal domain-containing protein [Pseudoalteromonas sp. SR43-6]MBB1412275.1 glycoside hydrolase family 3 C-terminal domain-containing protein [Pseudoalteromonas sp. SG43-8]
MVNKNIKDFIALTAIATLVSCAPHKQSNTDIPLYLNESATTDERVNDLVNRLTLEEKVAQLFDKSPAIERLNIPKYNWWNEALHGVARAGKATVFPQAIGLAATFDEDLMLKVGTAISDEGRAKHHAFLNENNHSMYTGLTYWSPNINIFRDPRWGRGQETYGEDPYLTTRIAVNFINGLQGDNSKYLKSVATLKHYAVHSGPEVSRHSDDYTASKKDLAETYLPAFKDVIAQTDVASVMCAYNSVNGTPACGNNELIQNKLRDEFNFKGYIVSDCGAIADFYDIKSHNIVSTEAQAAAMALRTGTDLNCGDHHGNTYSYLTQAVQEGLVEENDIDIALKRLMYARFKLGMFDDANNVPFSKKPMTLVGSTEHLKLTEEAAQKSLVLLKNKQLLPLKGNEKIALIGPNANNTAILLGNYNGTPIKPITPKYALEKRLGKNKLTYSAGSSITGEVYTHYQPIEAKHFFHLDHNNQMQPGLIAQYYPASNFDRQPAKRQIDKNIDFSWERSPIDNSIEQEFAVKWDGIIKPEQTAQYYFKATNISFTLNGKTVNGAITLNKNEEYILTAQAKFNHFWHSNVINPTASLGWLKNPQNLTQQALDNANEADVIVFVGGISANLEGEEMPLQIEGFSHGDRTNINLPKSQLNLLKKLKQTGKPIVLVNMSGSAMALNWENENIDAIVQGFYPGEAAGSALAGLLYGDFSPSGKLPITFYKSVSDLPDFKNYSMQNRTYKYYEGEVLYPFGYGLSYADFKYKNTRHSINADTGDLNLTTIIANQSSFTADDVVQVYISMPDAPIKTPNKQLVSFKHVTLKNKTQNEVEFTVPKNQLTYINEQGNAVAYKGRLIVTVGSGQGIKIPKDKFTVSNIVL